MRTYTVTLKNPADKVLKIDADDVEINYAQDGERREYPVAYNFFIDDEATVAFLPYDNVLFMESVEKKDSEWKA